LLERREGVGKLLEEGGVLLEQLEPDVVLLFGLDMSLETTQPNTRSRREVHAVDTTDHKVTP